MRVCTSMGLCLYSRIQIQTRTRVCVCVCVCVSTHVGRYIHPLMHVYVSVYGYGYSCTPTPMPVDFGLGLCAGLVSVISRFVCVCSAALFVHNRSALRLLQVSEERTRCLGVRNSGDMLFGIFSSACLRLFCRQTYFAHSYVFLYISFSQSFSCSCFYAVLKLVTPSLRYRVTVCSFRGNNIHYRRSQHFSSSVFLLRYRGEFIVGLVQARWCAARPVGGLYIHLVGSNHVPTSFLQCR